MKKWLFFFMFNAVFSGYGQSLSGKVLYAIKPIEFDVKSEDPKVKMVYAEMKKRAEKQLYVLDFNSSKGRFTIQEALGMSSNEKEKLLQKATSLVYGTTGVYFYDKFLKKIAIQLNDGTLLYKIESLNWNITTENKIIGGYLCYKATCDKKFMNKYGEIKYIPIVAWFAPALPYSYGPKDFNGLPGLILELQEKETTFYATNIIINKDKELEIKFPKGKMFEEEEYNRKFIMVK